MYVGKKRRNYGAPGVANPKRRRKATYQRPVLLKRFSTPSGSNQGATVSYVKFNYCELGFTINPGLASAGDYVFSLNGMFDPNITGVGHQPAGFDQYMAIFEAYTVYYATYKVSITNPDSNAYAIHMVHISDVATTNTDPRVYIENGDCQWNIAGNGIGSHSNQSYFSGSVDIAKAQGVTRQNLFNTDPFFAGTSSANPTDQQYLHIVVGPADSASDLPNQVVTVEICYYARLTGQKLNALS